VGAGKLPLSCRLILLIANIRKLSSYIGIGQPVSTGIHPRKQPENLFCFLV